MTGFKHDFGDGRGRVDAHFHSNGGGLVGAGANVAHTAHVGKEAKVFGFASVSGYAVIDEYAQVGGHANVSGKARIYGAALVGGHAIIAGDAHVCGNARVFGIEKLYSGKHTGTNPAIIHQLEPNYYQAILSTLPIWDRLDHVPSGEKQILFRELAEKIRKHCPEAADFLSSW